MFVLLNWKCSLVHFKVTPSFIEYILLRKKFSMMKEVQKKMRRSILEKLKCFCRRIPYWFCRGPCITAYVSISISFAALTSEVLYGDLVESKPYTQSTNSENRLALLTLTRCEEAINHASRWKPPELHGAPANELHNRAKFRRGKQFFH